MRLMPHDQDGGAFFVAVFEKVGGHQAANPGPHPKPHPHLHPHPHPNPHLHPHTSHLTPHTSHLTPHPSHLTPHPSQVGEHEATAGALPDDEPEVCVTEGGAVLPEALSTNHRDPKATDPKAALLPAATPSSADNDAARPTTAAAPPSGSHPPAPSVPPPLPPTTKASCGAHSKGDSLAAPAADAAAPPSATPADILPPEYMVDDCTQHKGVLHAYGGATVEAAAAAAYGCSYAPLFTPTDALSQAVNDFFGLSSGFPLQRLAARSAQVTGDG